jgi:lipopolysaccharide export system protein LptA
MSHIRKAYSQLRLKLVLVAYLLIFGMLGSGFFHLLTAHAEEQFMAMGNTVVIEANEQEVDLKNNVSYFKGNVVVRSGETVIKAPQGKVLMDANAQPSVANFEGGVVVSKGQDSLKSSTLIFDFKKEAFTASGGVDTRITPKGKSPIRIQSQTQQYLKSNSQMLASGNVRITSEDANATSEQALLVLGANNTAERITFSGGSYLTQKDSTVSASRIVLLPKQNVFMAEGNAVTRVKQAGNPQPIVLRSAYQQLDRNKGLLIASGAVDLDFEDYKAKGPKAVFYMSQGESMDLKKAVFSGRSTLNEGNLREVTADTIEVTVNPRYFDARGNVKTKLIQKPKTQTARQSTTLNNQKSTASNKAKPITEEDQYNPKAFEVAPLDTSGMDES